MKKLMITLILSVFMSNHVFASIDESQIDLYYANGMLMDVDEDVAEFNWATRVNKLKQQNPKLKNTDAKFAYNSSALGGVDDGIEAFFQWLGEKNILVTWATAVEFLPIYLEPFLGLPSWTNALNSVDLNTQINAYKQSIKDGHGVIVVAHSQGKRV